MAKDVGVNQTLTQTVQLAVGEVTETMEVVAQAELIERSTSELGTVIPEKAVNDLPLNGRNFTQLLTLTPGATPVSTSQNRSIGGVEGNIGIPGSGFSDPSFHEQQNRSKLYFFDGIINTNIRGPMYIVIPNVDLIQEFKVVGHDAKAEFGGATGGVTNIVSKSGGSTFHGSLFEYVRNDAFDARNAVTESTRSSPAPFRQNQFGAAVTGPILKNRTFFSVGYDGWRYSKPAQTFSYVPTPAELNGDFSQTTVVRSPSGGVRDLFNPFSGSPRQQFQCDAAGNPLPTMPGPGGTRIQPAGTPCSKLPPDLISAKMQQFMKTYSATPNLPGDPALNFIQNRSTTNNSNSFQVRVDHRFRDSDNVFFRYTEQRVSILNPIGQVGFTEGSGKGRNYGGGWVHIFSPNVILDLRAGYAGRPGVDAGQQNKHPAGLDPMKQAGFADIDKYQGMLVRLNTNEWTNGGNNDFGIRGAAPRENPNWSITPNVSWIKGNHNLAGPVPSNPDARCGQTISRGGRAADATRTTATWFNPCAFTVPSGSFGNFGRNVLRGRGVFNMDLSMFKSIALPREGWKLQLRIEAFNVFNVQNWDAPGLPVTAGTTIGGAEAGRITGLAIQPRQLQFGLRFVF